MATTENVYTIVNEQDPCAASYEQFMVVLRHVYCCNDDDDQAIVEMSEDKMFLRLHHDIERDLRGAEESSDEPGESLSSGERAELLFNVSCFEWLDCWLTCQL